MSLLDFNTSKFFGSSKRKRSTKGLGCPAPTKKPRCIVHPENVPRILHDSGLPKDFTSYAYAGAALETLTKRHLNDRVIRRPALVAKMVMKYNFGEEGTAEMEMTASLSDLRAGRHPHAEAIAAALTAYYEEKVPGKEKEPVTGMQKLSSLIPEGLNVVSFFTKLASGQPSDRVWTLKFTNRD